MATATTKERKFRSELLQDRAETKKTTKVSKKTDSGVDINTAEMLIVLGAAITVDIIDALDLTGVGAILVRFIDIPTLGALWLWRIVKTGPRKDPTFALLAAFLVELSPAGMIPTWSIFVGYIYLQDTKLGKQTIGKAKKATKIKTKSK